MVIIVDLYTLIDNIAKLEFECFVKRGKRDTCEEMRLKMEAICCLDWLPILQFQAWEVHKPKMERLNLMKESIYMIQYVAMEMEGDKCTYKKAFGKTALEEEILFVQEEPADLGFADQSNLLEPIASSKVSTKVIGRCDF